MSYQLGYEHFDITEQYQASFKCMSYQLGYNLGLSQKVLNLVLNVCHIN